jgi:signal transduction histidine kinase
MTDEQTGQADSASAQNFTHLFAARKAPGADSSRHGMAFCRLLILCFCLIPLSLAIVLASSTGRWIGLLAAAPFLGFACAACYLLNRGRLQAGFSTIVYGAWLSLMAVIGLLNGVHSPGASALCLVLGLSGWLAGRRTTLTLAAATPCALLLIAYAESSGWALPVHFAVPLWYAALVPSLVAIAAGALGYLAARALSDHLETERSSRVRLASSLAELASREKELTAARESLHEANATLEAKVDDRTARLEGALRELKAFSYSISHDLRTPLRAINGQSNILLEEEEEVLSPTARRRLGTVAKSADHMGKMIDTLLVVIALSQAEIRREPVHMRNLVTNAAAVIHSRHPAVRIEIGEMPMAFADPALIRQLLDVLLDNAFNYSAGREIQRIEAGWDADKHAWYVRDNGIGFEMRYAHRLWGLFERLQPRPEAQGMGTGLAIASRIVERHGGSIWAQATPDVGATFFFTLAAPDNAHTDAPAPLQH